MRRTRYVTTGTIRRWNAYREEKTITAIRYDMKKAAQAIAD